MKGLVSVLIFGICAANLCISVLCRSQDLNFRELSFEYELARNRLVLLDFDVFLFSDNYPDICAEKEEFFCILDNILKVSTNILYVVSSRRKEDLQMFSRTCRLGLVAEEGLFIKFPGHKEWTDLRSGCSDADKNDIKEEIQGLVETCRANFHNSSIEIGESYVSLYYNTSEVRISDNNSNTIEDTSAKIAKIIDRDTFKNQGIPRYEIFNDKSIIKVREFHEDRNRFMQKIITSDLSLDFLLFVGGSRFDKDLCVYIDSHYRNKVPHLYTVIIEVDPVDTKSGYRIDSYYYAIMYLKVLSRSLSRMW